MRIDDLSFPADIKGMKDWRCRTPATCGWRGGGRAGARTGRARAALGELQASACLAELAQGRAAWAVAWPCLHAFVAIATHPKIYRPPSPLAVAIEQVEAWLESPTLQLVGEPAG